MSSVLDFVYPCACSKQNGLYKVAPVPSTPTEESRPRRRCVCAAGGRRRPRLRRRAWAPRPAGSAPPPEDGAHHLRQKQTRETSLRGQEFKEYKIRRLPVFHAFLALKIPRMMGAWGEGGVIWGEVFVWFCYFETRKSFRPLCAIAPPPGVVAVRWRVVSTRALSFPCDLPRPTSVLLRTDYTLILLLARSGAC